MLELVLGNAAFEQRLVEERWIADHRLTIDEREVGLLPVPFEAAGRVSLELTFSDGGTLRAEGSGLQLLEIGEAKFVEKIPF